MFNVELLSEAEDELSDAYNWYEKQLSNLGDRFYREVNQYLTLLEHDPYQFPVKYADDLRAVPLNKFPFLVIYWIDSPDNTVLSYRSFIQAGIPNISNH